MLQNFGKYFCSSFLQFVFAARFFCSKNTFLVFADAKNVSSQNCELSSTPFLAKILSSRQIFAIDDEAGCKWDAAAMTRGSSTCGSGLGPFYSS